MSVRAVTHKDSLDNEGRTEAGDVQVMSGGAGIRHAEYNLADARCGLSAILPAGPRHPP
jgi:quercetin 2,3-dioxygenase